MSSTFYDYMNDFDNISNSMKLEDSSIIKFKVSKELLENKDRINSIDFSQDGKSLITSSDDDNIVVYDCEKGVKRNTVASKKYGVDLIRYTHGNNCAIHTSTKENNTIRYLSVHDNKYLRYFSGHEKRVVSLCMSPADDAFLSASLDHTVRLWDLRTEKPTAKLQSEGPPIANFDPEGLIFAVGMNSEIIKLYDLRLYDKGPFNTVKLSKAGAKENLNWNSLKFSPNGRQILITTNYETLHLLDAFTVEPYKEGLLTFGPELDAPLVHTCEASFSPDSQYILSGSGDGCIHVWDSKKFRKVVVLKPERPNAEPVNCVKFNPKYMLIASACSRMSFWIPTGEDL